MKYCFQVRLPSEVKSAILLEDGASISATVCAAILRFNGDVISMPKVTRSKWRSMDISADESATYKVIDIAKQFGLKESEVLKRLVGRAVEDGSLLENIVCKQTTIKPERIDGDFVYVGVACSKNVRAVKFGITTDIVTRLETHKRSMAKLQGTFTPVACIRMSDITLARQCEIELLSKFKRVDGIHAFKSETAPLHEPGSILEHCRAFEISAVQQSSMSTQTHHSLLTR